MYVKFKQGYATFVKYKGYKREWKKKNYFATITWYETAVSTCVEKCFIQNDFVYL